MAFVRLCLFLVGGWALGIFVAMCFVKAAGL